MALIFPYLGKTRQNAFDIRRGGGCWNSAKLQTIILSIS